MSGPRIAEQVRVNATAAQVAAALQRRPATWIKPFLALAWNTVQQPARSTPRRMTAAANAVHHIRLSHPVAPQDSQLDFGFRWTVRDAVEVTRLTGRFVVLPLGEGCVLAAFGDVAGARTDASGTSAIRNDELVLRSLLGHLRTAIEQASA